MPIAELHPVIDDEETLRGMYMPNELEAGLLRQKLDQLEKAQAKHEAEAKIQAEQLATLLERKHQAQSAARTLVENRVTEIEKNNIALFGKEGISKGVIFEHTEGIGKLWGKYRDLKTRYWKLLFALASAGALGGGAVKLLGF